MAPKKVLMAASGDLRQSANETCWPAQEAMEKKVAAAVAAFGVEVERAHPYDPALKHGFIASQKEGLEVFAKVDPDTPIIVAEAVWQYTNHVLPGLLAHRAPILTVANWSGEWPGLVGMLNLNGSLTKAGKPYSTLWSETFHRRAVQEEAASVAERRPRDARPLACPRIRSRVGARRGRRRSAKEIAADLRRRKAIMGIFDEGCMGMYNAIIPDELLFPLGVFKERLSQSALYAASREVPDAEARAVYDWLVKKGFTFHFGKDPATELTLDQVLDQCQMYIAAARIAEAFGCDAIGIQYQQGMKDLMPASDLVEGMLNNDDRPPVMTADGKPIRDGQAIVHFNEVDECAGLDALFTNRVHRALGQPAETTLHDIRWGDADRSGTDQGLRLGVRDFRRRAARPPHRRLGRVRQPAPAADVLPARRRHGARHRQARPDRLVARIRRGGQAQDGPRPRPRGRASARRRRSGAGATPTPQWPIMHAVLHGVSRDQMMARHKANHIQVAYANSDDGGRSGVGGQGGARRGARPRSVAVRRRSGTDRRCCIDAGITARPAGPPADKIGQRVAPQRVDERASGKASKRGRRGDIIEPPRDSDERRRFALASDRMRKSRRRTAGGMVSRWRPLRSFLLKASARPSRACGR